MAQIRYLKHGNNIITKDSNLSSENQLRLKMSEAPDVERQNVENYLASVVDASEARGFSRRRARKTRGAAVENALSMLNGEQDPIVGTYYGSGLSARARTEADNILYEWRNQKPKRNNYNSSSYGSESSGYSSTDDNEESWYFNWKDYLDTDFLTENATWQERGELFKQALLDALDAIKDKKKVIGLDKSKLSEFYRFVNSLDFSDDSVEAKNALMKRIRDYASKLGIKGSDLRGLFPEFWQGPSEEELNKKELLKQGWTEIELTGVAAERLKGYHLMQNKNGQKYLFNADYTPAQQRLNSFLSDSYNIVNGVSTKAEDYGKIFMMGEDGQVFWDTVGEEGLTEASPFKLQYDAFIADFKSKRDTITSDNLYDVYNSFVEVNGDYLDPLLQRGVLNAIAKHPERYSDKIKSSVLSNGKLKYTDVSDLFGSDTQIIALGADRDSYNNVVFNADTRFAWIDATGKPKIGDYRALLSANPEIAYNLSGYGNGNQRTGALVGSAHIDLDNTWALGLSGGDDIYHANWIYNIGSGRFRGADMDIADNPQGFVNAILAGISNPTKNIKDYGLTNMTAGNFLHRWIDMDDPAGSYEKLIASIIQLVRGNQVRLNSTQQDALKALIGLYTRLKNLTETSMLIDILSEKKGGTLRNKEVALKLMQLRKMQYGGSFYDNLSGQSMYLSPIATTERSLQSTLRSKNIEKLNEEYARYGYTSTSQAMAANKPGLNGSDILRAASLALDIGAVIASFTGVGKVVGAGLSIGSTVTDLAADFSDESISTGQALKNATYNLGLGAATALIPTAKLGRIGARAAKLVPYILMSVGAVGMANDPATKQAIDKLQKGKFNQMTKGDWHAIYYVLKLAAGAGQMAGRGVYKAKTNKAYNAAVESNKAILTPTTKGYTSQSGTVKLNAAQTEEVANALKNGNKLDAINLIKQHNPSASESEISALINSVETPTGWLSKIPGLKRFARTKTTHSLTGSATEAAAKEAELRAIEQMAARELAYIDKKLDNSALLRFYNKLLGGNRTGAHTTRLLHERDNTTLDKIHADRVKLTEPREAAELNALKNKKYTYTVDENGRLINDRDSHLSSLERMQNERGALRNASLDTEIGAQRQYIRDVAAEKARILGLSKEDLALWLQREMAKGTNANMDLLGDKEIIEALEKSLPRSKSAIQQFINAGRELRNPNKRLSPKIASYETARTSAQEALVAGEARQAEVSSLYNSRRASVQSAKAEIAELNKKIRDLEIQKNNVTGKNKDLITIQRNGIQVKINALKAERQTHIDSIKNTMKEYRSLASELNELINSKLPSLRNKFNVANNRLNELTSLRDNLIAKASSDEGKAIIAKADKYKPALESHVAPVSRATSGSHSAYAKFLMDTFGITEAQLRDMHIWKQGGKIKSYKFRYK